MNFVASGVDVDKSRRVLPAVCSRTAFASSIGTDGGGA